jgi:hypothetical protein
VSKITPAGTQTTVGSGFISPIDVTVDAAGDVYVSDHGTDAVDEVTPGGVQSTLSSAFNVPGGMAIDSSGNLYVADTSNQRIAKIERATAHSVNFSTPTNEGSTDTTNGTMTVQVSNIGNQPLNFTSLIYPADFSEASGDSSACTSTTSLNPAGECDVLIEFTPKNPGSPLIESVTLTDNALNTAGTQQSISVSGTALTQNSQTITFNPAITSYTYSPSGTFAVSATASSSLAVNFASTTSSICSVSGSTVTILSVGICTIEATQAGNTNYSAATPVSVNFTINPASQTISFTPSTSPVTFGGSPISLSATGGASGNAIVFSVVSGPGSINGSTLSVSGVGTILVAANQAGNTNYTVATQVTQNVVVNLAVLTIAANNATKVYGTANPSFTGSMMGAVNSNTFTESFATTASTSSAVGVYAIVPSVTGADLSDYTQSIADGMLTVTQAGTTTALTGSSGSITPGQSVTLVAQVSSATTGTPTGTVSFYDGTALLSTVQLTAGTASYTTAALAPGITNSIGVTYNGDTNFTGSSTTSPVSVAVAPLDFTMTILGPSTATVALGSSIPYQVNVNPNYGSYAGTVNFAVDALPPGATVTFSPSSIAANGGPQTITMTIQTATATAASHTSSPSSASRMAPFALACLLLFGAGSLRKRGRELTRLLSIVALLTGGALATLTLSGCGTTNGSSAQAPQNYTITIIATAGSLQHTTNVTLNVQ